VVQLSSNLEVGPSPGVPQAGFLCVIALVNFCVSCQGNVFMSCKCSCLTSAGVGVDAVPVGQILGAAWPGHAQLCHR
jgi:hypothetical protein